MLTVSSIAHVAIRVKDVDASLDFYINKLGFKEMMRLDRDGKLWLVYLRVTDDQFLEVFPDGEGGPDQPTSVDLEAAAKAAGLAYVYFPVATMMVTPAQVTRYQALCADLPHPIAAFCAAGGRANVLFQAVGCRVGRPG